MAEERSESQNDKDMRRIMKVGGVLFGSAIIFMVGLFVLVQTDTLRMHPKNMRPDALENLSLRVVYALRYQTLLVFWLLFGVLVTIYGRITTKALNPLERETESRIGIFKNVLNNSFESVTISVFAQLIFVTFADPVTVLKFIPLVNIVQFIGRIAFFAGYPMKRGFGFACTLLPNTVLVVYNLFKFGSFVGLY